jgi:hypothetical protein
MRVHWHTHSHAHAHATAHARALTCAVKDGVIDGIPEGVAASPAAMAPNLTAVVYLSLTMRRHQAPPQTGTGIGRGPVPPGPWLHQYHAVKPYQGNTTL